MIQRIQTIYLSIIFLLSLLFLQGSFLSFDVKSGSQIKITITNIVSDSGLQDITILEKAYPLSVIIILLAIISLITIVLFKNRKIQIWLSLAVIFIIAAFIGTASYYAWIVTTKYGAEIVPGMKMILLPVMMICAVLAYRGIKKDDNLVKSYDRLR